MIYVSSCSQAVSLFTLQLQVILKILRSKKSVLNDLNFEMLDHELKCEMLVVFPLLTVIRIWQGPH